MKTTTKLILLIIANVIPLMADRAIFANSTNTCNESKKTVACWKQSKLVYAKSAEYSAVSLDALVSAITIIESNGRTNIMGDQGKTAGCLQISRCALLDVNRRFGRTYSWPSDCLNEKTAWQIAKFYLVICGYGKRPLEETIRRYNAGKHWQSDAAGRYFKKVMKELR